MKTVYRIVQPSGAIFAESMGDIFSTQPSSAFARLTSVPRALLPVPAVAAIWPFALPLAGCGSSAVSGASASTAAVDASGVDASSWNELDGGPVAPETEAATSAPDGALGAPQPGSCGWGQNTATSTWTVSNSVGNYSLYIPANVCFVRCVYVHPLEEQYDITTDPVVQASGQTNACSLLQIDFTISIGEWHNSVRGGSGQATVDALKQLATTSGHPELANAPWVAMGFSAGAAFATSFGQQFPERTIAVAAWHGGWGVGSGTPNLDAVVQVPVLYFGGWCDGVDLWPTDLMNFESVRSLGGPDALAIEMIGHSPQNCGNLTWPYFNAIIPLRLPTTVPDAGPVSLRPIDQSPGYLGDNDTGAYGPASSLAQGDPKSLSWLPDKSLVEGWKNFILNDGSQNGSNKCPNGPQPPRP